MKWEEQVRAFGSLVIARILKRRHLADLSVEAGYEKSYLSQLNSRPLSIRVGTALRLLELAGVEWPADVFLQAFRDTSVEPVRLLASNRCCEGLPPSPFLVDVAPRVLALLTPGPVRRWRSQLSKIRKFELLRFSTLPLAQAKLESLVSVGLALCTKAPRPPAAYCDLACALASLAVVYRTAGRLDDALDTLMLAWPLAMAPDIAHGEGIWNQKAAYLAAYLNRTDLGFDFARKAAVHFIEAKADDDLARTLVDLGFLHSRAGQSKEACNQLRRALKVLPAADREYRLAAHQILAGQLVNLGCLVEAIQQLEEAEALITEGDLLLRASLSWGRARLHLAEGDGRRAAKAFSAAIPLLRKHGSPADSAEITLDYAEHLLKAKNRPELQALAAGCAPYFTTVACATQIREAMEDFVALVTMNQLVLESLVGLRAQLPQTSQPIPRKRADQPPGGISQPLSGSELVAGLLFGGGASSDPVDG